MTGPRCTVRALRPDDAGACAAIIASLPYHFGLEAGRAECARAVQEQDGLAAVAGGTVAGFLTWRTPADRYLLVTTLSESVPEPGVEDGYDRTRRFYRRNGFTPVWEPSGWWDGEYQAVLMVRPL